MCLSAGREPSLVRQAFKLYCLLLKGRQVDITELVPTALAQHRPTHCASREEDIKMFGDNCGGRTIVCTSVAAIFLGLSALWWQNWRKKKLLFNAIPNQWRAVGEVDELSLYPLKSGRGIRVNEAECTDVGLRMINEDSFKLADRTFLVFNEQNGTFQTCRQQPKMVLISIHVAANGKVVFEAPDMTTKLEISVPDATGERKICSMWYQEQVDTIDCGDEAAAWFSEYIKGNGQTTGLRLGYYPGPKGSTVKRTVSKMPWKKAKSYFTKLRDEDYGVYSDLASFMILGVNSVGELNTRLASPVTAVQFRPNILVRGSDPYAEDAWDWVKIGESAVFRSVKPCTRCVVTTIDPEKGVMDKENKEPLKTLKSYRKLTDPQAVALEGDSPVMGLYMGLHVPGVIHVGDKVYVGSNA